MVLRSVSPKVRYNILSQQMWSDDWFLEDGDLRLSPLPSNSVANYDHLNTNISTSTRSTVIESLRHDTESSLPEAAHLDGLDLTLKSLTLLSPEAAPLRHNDN